MPGSVPNTEYINIAMIKKKNFLLSHTIVGGEGQHYKTDKQIHYGYKLW